MDEWLSKRLELPPDCRRLAGSMDGWLLEVLSDLGTLGLLCSEAQQKVLNNEALLRADSKFGILAAVGQFNGRGRCKCPKQDCARRAVLIAQSYFPGSHSLAAKISSTSKLLELSESKSRIESGRSAGQ